MDTLDQPVSWPHAPLHRLSERGMYFVTAGTYQKLHHFQSEERLGVLCRGLLKVCAEAGWRLEAWSVFSNHYHFVAESPSNVEGLAKMLGKLHEKTAKWINRRDKSPGRRVWHNYWETLLTYERSYLARLQYTHQNAVKHGLVQVAEDYPWCSAGWFLKNGSPAMVKTLARFKIDQINVPDDYDVERR